MVSAGQDMKMAVWDVRMFKEVHNTSSPSPDLLWPSAIEALHQLHSVQKFPCGRDYLISPWKTRRKFKDPTWLGAPKANAPKLYDGVLLRMY